ncbi:hypothetical protein ACFXTH_040808 [Malus domestica]
MNAALLAKSTWRLLQRDDGLWASTFRGKYLSGVNSDILKWPTGRVASSSWRAVVYGGQLLKNCLIWRVGSGANISFWFDAWLDDGILADKALIPLDVSAKAVKVIDFCYGNCWNVSALRAVLPEEYVWKISTIPIGLNDGDSDCIIWKHSNYGNFSVKSAYLASIDYEDFADWSWSDIWKLKLPPRVLHFLWLTLSRTDSDIRPESTRDVTKYPYL